MCLQEFGEIYLEVLPILSRKQGYVRSIDVSEYLVYSKPSALRVVGLLKSSEYLIMEDDGGLTLTDSGWNTLSAYLTSHYCRILQNPIRF